MGLAAFVEEVIARVREAPVDLSLLPPAAIEGTLFSGAAGVAFFLHEMARLRGEDDLLPLARRWLDAAGAWAGGASRSDWKDLPRGFLIGEAGVAYVDALLWARAGDSGRVHRAVRAVERVTERFDDLAERVRPSDLVAGAAGVVCLARDLDGRLPRRPEYDEIRATLACVRDRALPTVQASCAAPLREDASLGFAHGVAGDLWLLVQVLGAEHPAVEPRLKELAGLREVDEEGLVFWLPRRGQWDVLMVGTLCNGMAGHSLLWTEVARRSRTAESMELARLSAESLAALADPNPGLCCGLAGHSLALQRFAELSGDVRFARLAYDRLARAARSRGQLRDAQAFGLWQGALGVALVAMARLGGETTLPLLEPLA